MSVRDVAVHLLLLALAVSALAIAVVALVEARKAHSHSPPSSTMRPTDTSPAANPTTFDTDFIGSYQLVKDPKVLSDREKHDALVMLSQKLNRFDCAEATIDGNAFSMQCGHDTLKGNFSGIADTREGHVKSSEFMVVLRSGNLLNVEVNDLSEDNNIDTGFYGVFWQGHHLGHMVSDKDTDYYKNARLVLDKGAKDQIIIRRGKNTHVLRRAALPAEARQELIKNGELPDGMQNV